MKIYVRKKKPKLYGLLIFSIVFVIAVAVLYAISQSTSFNALPYITVSMPLYFAAVLVILVISLKRQIEYNPYSYNTIYYFGFSLFVLSLLVTHIAAAIRYFMDTGEYGFRDTARIILWSARQYMIVTFPLLAVFSIGLLVSNIVLIKKEGKSLTNTLGILLAVALMAGEGVLIWLGSIASGPFGIAINLLCAIFVYAECMLFGAIFADILVAAHVPAYDKDYILILGCKVAKSGEPMPILQKRIDRAIAFYDEQVSRTGKAPVFIPSGGKGADEPLSEAECMRNYLIAKGFTDEQIIMEDESKNTIQNMRFSFKKVPEEAKCAFSTSGYHVFRSGIAANRAQKFKAEGVGAPSRWYFWPNASVREFIGLLTGHRGKQLLVLFGLIAAYLLLSFLAG